jgi:hypothetical protein
MEAYVTAIDRQIALIDMADFACFSPEDVVGPFQFGSQGFDLGVYWISSGLTSASDSTNLHDVLPTLWTEASQASRNASKPHTPLFVRALDCSLNDS